MNTLTDVINDTIAVERLVTPQKPAQSTLNFMTQPTQQGTNGAVSFPSQNTSWEGGRGRGRGRSRGRGKGTSNKTPQCWICMDNSAHWSHSCPIHTTVAKKRTKLEKDGRCIRCGYWAHPDQKECMLHKACRHCGHKGLHRSYLCDEADKHQKTTNTSS